MKTACAKVLAMLRKARKHGVAFNDFARGFRLGARVYDLRREGFDIITVKEPMGNGATYARYILMREQTLAPTTGRV
jgi:hypothetical protein